MRRLAILLVLCGLGMAACSADEPAPLTTDAQPSADVVRELDGLQQLRDRFNADVERPRFVTILSST